MEPTGAETPLIVLQHVSKTYRLGETCARAVRDVSLDVGPGEFVALTGPSGCGKSTLLYILGCLARPTSGSYLFEGRDVAALSTSELAGIRNHDIGFVFQGFHLLPRTSALENVELPMLYDDGIPSPIRRRRAAAALDLVGLGNRLQHLSNQLSGGQQQRVATARALVNGPSLLLADEPTGNLDTRTSLEVLDILQGLNSRRGLAIVLVTHELDIVRYAARLVTLCDGRVAGDEPVRHPQNAATDLAALPVDQIVPPTPAHAA